MASYVRPSDVYSTLTLQTFPGMCDTFTRVIVHLVEQAIFIRLLGNYEVSQTITPHFNRSSYDFMSHKNIREAHQYFHNSHQF